LAAKRAKLINAAREIANQRNDYTAK